MSEQIKKEEKEVTEDTRTEEIVEIEPVEETIIEETTIEKTVVENTVDGETETAIEEIVESVTEEKRYPSYRERKRLKQEERQRKKEADDKLISEIAVAQAELEALKKEHGLEEEKGVKKLISNFFDKRENREKVAVSKKTYLILSILLGWMGAHRFYSKQYGLGLLYLATCWTGFPVSLMVIDVLIVIPMKPDENGQIYL